MNIALAEDAAKKSKVRNMPNPKVVDSLTLDGQFNGPNSIRSISCVAGMKRQ